MRRFLAVTLGTLLLAGLTLAAPQNPKETSLLLCTLTNKKVEKCCCEPRGDKQYCLLAQKLVDRCCCRPTEVQKNKKK